jgi:hypothetical protein
MFGNCVGHKNKEGILSGGRMTLSTAMVQHHGGYLKCGRMLIVTGEIAAAVCVLKTADFHNLHIHYN